MTAVESPPRALPPPAIAVEGAVGRLTPAQESTLLSRGRAADPRVARAVADVVEAVRTGGDEALRALARRFDGAELTALEVPREVVERALAELAPDVRRALQQAADAIAAFHRAQLATSVEPLELEVRPGVRLGRRTEPLRRVGVYAPGGRAAYPSSVLMGVVPARVAGVEEIVVCSPPGPDGLPPAAALAACALAGADRVFALGGAGAVAAMAFGTPSVPRVDKVVGPGNAYVAEAKRQLAAVIASDCPAGPSEILVIADESAAPRLVAAELVAQAEHDPDASAVLVSTDARLVERVRDALVELLRDAPRADIVRDALAARGALLTAVSLDEALAFAERYAPEHLALLVAEPRAALAKVRCAGSVFLGAASSVTFGDYLTGANHVLPTAGWARSCGGLSAADFVRSFTWQEVSPEAAALLAAPTALLAETEGLPGHALAARLRSFDEGAALVALDVASIELSAKAAVPSSAVTDSHLQAPIPRPELRDVQRYRGAGGERVPLDLSDNTNLFGAPPPAARALLGGVDDALVTRYPSPYADELRGCLAARLGVAPENVTTGCGSDDLLDSVLRAFCASGDRMVHPSPTFGIVPSFARVSGAVPFAVPLCGDLSLDVDGLVAARGAVTYLCRPNNPTGTLFARADVERLAASLPGLLLLDEAYADFAGEGEVSQGLGAWSVASRNVVSLRTLSKAYGLAGLRVGYAVGPAELIAAVEKARGPYKVGALAEAVALAVLREDDDWVRGRVAATRGVRERLTGELRDRGLAVLESAANFVFVPLPPESGGATALAATLRERGVGVRAFGGLPVIGEGIRVTVGPWPLMQRFLDALDKVQVVAVDRAKEISVTS